MKGALDRWLESGLERLAAASQLRERRTVEPVGGLQVRVDGRELVLFAGNDYLGLSFHPRVVGAARAALDRAGLGPRGSALVCGRTDEHAALEAELATLCSAPAALLFPSGWAANAGTLAALGGTDLEIYSDELNHASLIEGCRLAARMGAAVEVYRHRDLDQLEELLRRPGRARRLVVSDSVFSMDGDEAPLRDLAALRERYGFALMLDEAHATLLYGNRGGGLAEEQGVEEAVDVHVGTLSKAVGALGGFVAGTQRLVDWLFNRNRAGVFSTALPVPIVAAARAALVVSREEPALRGRLAANRRVCEPLAGEGRSPIVPVLVGGEDEALALSRSLAAVGFWVPAIRPPTVPAGTSRLRIALSAAHQPEQVAELVAAIQETQRRLAAADGR